MLACRAFLNNGWRFGLGPKPKRHHPSSPKRPWRDQPFGWKPPDAAGAPLGGGAEELGVAITVATVGALALPLELDELPPPLELGELPPLLDVGVDAGGVDAGATGGVLAAVGVADEEPEEVEEVDVDVFVPDPVADEGVEEALVAAV
jgi:hypothetical protein